MSFKTKFSPTSKEDKDEIEPTTKKADKKDKDSLSDSAFRSKDKEKHPKIREDKEESQFDRINWSKPYIAERTPDKFDTIDWSRSSFPTHKPDQFDTIDWKKAHGTIVKNPKELPKAQLQIKKESSDEKRVIIQEELVDPVLPKTEEQMAQLYRKKGGRPYYRGDDTRGFKEFKKKFKHADALSQLKELKENGSSVLKDVNFLKKPCMVVDHYYDEIGSCHLSKDSLIKRHNYLVVSNQQISCKDCGHTILNSNIKESRLNLRKRELNQLENHKDAADFSIYRISMKRVLENGEYKWLPFPGINYIGQSVSFVSQRYSEHLRSAFSDFKKIQDIDKYIRSSTSDPKYQPSKRIARIIAKKNFKLETLQIIRFQGNLEKIRKIKDKKLRESAFNEAKKITQKLTNKVEKFWIGRFKTQFKEFGKNIEEGGKLNPSVDLYKVDSLFREGYLPDRIGRRVGLQGNKDSIRKTIIRNVKSNLYPHIFYPKGIEKPSISFREGRRIIFKEIIEDLVKNGYKSYKDMLEVLPGFGNPNANGRSKWHELKRLTLEIHGGIEKLNKKYHNKPRKEYYRTAIQLIKKHDRKYSDFSLAKDLGFIEDFGYSLSGLRKNSGKYIKKHLGKSISELREESFPTKSADFYLPKALELIRNNHRFGIQSGGYGSGRLLVDLNVPEHLNYSEKYIRDRGPKILHKILNKTYKELVDMTIKEK